MSEYKLSSQLKLTLTDMYDCCSSSTT
uniref:Uncharacterized protein n=1 Tax=Arundo donax TaxID=35708 RepID=A0A0A9AR43_ARUDO